MEGGEFIFQENDINPLGRGGVNGYNRPQ